MRLLPQEQKRLLQLAIAKKRVSADTRQEVTTKDLEEFMKEVRHILQVRKIFKNAMVVLVEVDKEKDK